jgi:hypothetical protein
VQTFWAGTVLEFTGCALLLLNWYPPSARSA